MLGNHGSPYSISEKPNPGTVEHENIEGVQGSGLPILVSEYVGARGSSGGPNYQ